MYREKLKIGIAVFAYCRKEHLVKVLEGLKQNEEVDKVYFFQDGLRWEADRKAWEETTQVIRFVDWCEKEIIIAEKNKGLSQSIIEGIKLVFEENDAIIILEDDCVPKPAFVSYMKQCFYKYKGNTDVFSVAGYSWPLNLKGNDSDIYFCGRPCSWGWGTWKDRWDMYVQDGNIIRDIKRDKEASRRLAIWGDDLENMLVSNYLGYNDSWYVYWALLTIKQGGYAINPYVSLIDNIGFDGTGVHCDVTDRFNVYEFDERVSGTPFYLKDDIASEEEVEKAFLNFYGNYSVTNEPEQKAEVLVYGIGRLYKRNAKAVCEKYYIKAFVDRWKKDLYYAGIDIIHPRQMSEMQYDYVLVMIEEPYTAAEVKETLLREYDIDEDKILMGNEMYN